MFVDVLNPRAMEHGRYCVVLQGGAKAVRRLYGYLAAGPWKQGVVRTFAVLSDLAACGRSGMNIDCAPLTQRSYDANMAHVKSRPSTPTLSPSRSSAITRLMSVNAKSTRP